MKRTSIMPSNYKTFLIEVSLPKLHQMYHTINRLAFNNELPKVEIAISSRLKNATGIAKCKIQNNAMVPGSLRITISDKYIMDDNALMSLMAHEMIHIYYYTKNNFKEAHGFLFKSKAREIGAKLNVQIQTTNDPTKFKLARGDAKTVCILIATVSGEEKLVILNPSSYQKTPFKIDEIIDYLKAIVTYQKVKIKEYVLLSGESAIPHQYPQQTIQNALRSPNVFKLTRRETKLEIGKLKIIKKWDGN